MNLDVYNALNVDTIVTENNAYARWRQAVRIMPARFAKISARFDF